MTLVTLHWLCIYMVAQFIACAVKEIVAQCKIFLKGTLPYT